MPAPVVAASASSSSELWRTHPHLFLPSSQDKWDERFLTQAQFSPCNKPSLSLAKALSHCLSGHPAWQTSDPQRYAAIISASQQAGGAFLQQKQQQEAERSNVDSPMSSSDLKETSRSALNSPTGANRNSTAGMPSVDSKPHDATEFLPKQENEEALAVHVGNALRASVTATPPRLDGERHGQAANWLLTAKASPTALSVHAALGSVGTKVNKRRSRATNKAPITVLSADTTNFREMVQKLTGIPVSPSMERTRFHFWNNQEASVLKPHPTRPSQSIQGLPTLDTSACLLVDGSFTSVHPQGSNLVSGDNLLQEYPNFACLKPLRQPSDSCLNGNLFAELGSTRAGTYVNQSGFSLGANSALKPSLSNLAESSSDFGASLPRLWDPNERGQECFPNKFSGKEAYNVLVAGADLYTVRQGASLESLTTGNERSENDISSRSFHPVESWFLSDTAFPKKTELARSA